MGFFGKDEDEQIRSYERSLARLTEEKEILEVKNQKLEFKINEVNKSNEQLKQAMEEIKEQFDSFKQQTLKEKEELQAKLKGEKLIKKKCKRCFDSIPLHSKTKERMDFSIRKRGYFTK